MKYFVTTGTSLDRARCWRPLRELPRPDDYAQNWTHLEDHPATYARLMKYVREDFATLRGYDPESAAEMFDADTWNDNNKRHLLSAELATLQAMSREKGGSFFAENDEIIFLCGTDNQFEAIVCCEIVKSLAQKDDSRIQGVSPSIWSASRWNPTNRGEFLGAMKQLWEYVRPPDYTKIDRRFVLTGAFKGVLIHLAYRMGVHKYKTHVYYLYEDGGDLIEDQDFSEYSTTGH